MTTLALMTTHWTAVLLTILITTIQRVDSYSNGSFPESCYTMLPNHISPPGGSPTPVAPINCSSSGTECSGLSLTVTQNGTTASHYSCDTEYEGSLYIILIPQKVYFEILTKADCYNKSCSHF